MRFDREQSPATVNGGKGWTQDRAVDWLNEHGLRADKVYEETGYFRFRQSDEKSENFATVETGMPVGVLLTTGDTPRAQTGCKVVDGKTIKGKSLAAFIEVALPQDLTKRAVVMRKMARDADVSLSTVHMLLGGKLNCPTVKTLEVFADCLDVPVDRLIAAAKRDGCSYE